MASDMGAPAAAVLQAGCAVAASPPTSSTPPASADRASPSSPSLDPSPSPSAAAYAHIGTPEPMGTALVIHQDWPDTGPLLYVTSVLTDGRVIRIVIEPDRPVVLTERLLSARGLELVLAAIDANRLFERSQDRPIVASPPACCGAGDAIKLLRGGREVTVGGC